MSKFKIKYLFLIVPIVINLLSYPGYCSEPVKNIILFIGDGMQQEHEIAASKYLTGTDNGLIWHNFPYRTYVSTWNIDSYNRYANSNSQPAFSKDKFNPLIGFNPALGGNKPYPETNKIDNGYFLKPLSSNLTDILPKAPATDSAAAATAIATGTKTDSGNISWLSEDPENGRIKTIAEIIREKKKASIGVITTVPFNHATPAAFVSHNTDRNHYYNNKDGYKGIAEEIIRTTKPEVVIGGGHPKFGGEKYVNKELYKEILSLEDYIVCERQKGKNPFLNSLKDSHPANYYDKKLFGLFGDKYGNFGFPKPVNFPDKPVIVRNTAENPTLAKAATTGLKVLSRNPNGFFLMIEQGEIDWANHENDYSSMVGSVADLNEAVEAVIGFINNPNDNIDWNNTLLIVTADHANSYMRIIKPEKLGKGYLPKQRRFFRNWRYPGKEIQYSLKDHTNELVNLYAIGNGKDLFKKYEGLWYPNTKIIDNTHIFEVMINALELNKP